jgi:hypothetical protein
MFRLAVAVSLLISAVCAVAQNSPSSDPFAVSLARQSVTALTGGAPITDVTLNANVTSILGSDNESGTGTFEAKGTSESRIDLNLSGGTRSDVRNISNGVPGGAWQKSGGTATQYAAHNCWTDAAWFFPSLSSLNQTANSSFAFKYIGQEQHGGVNVQHVRVFQFLSQNLPPVNVTDFYLDVNSLVPLAIGFILNADNDKNTNIPNEVRFANYKVVSGVQIPFHFQQISNGSINLDVTVTSAAVNTGLLDSSFTLQ